MPAVTDDVRNEAKRRLFRRRMLERRLARARRNGYTTIAATYEKALRAMPGTYAADLAKAQGEAEGGGR